MNLPRKKPVKPTSKTMMMMMRTPMKSRKRGSIQRSGTMERQRKMTMMMKKRKVKRRMTNNSLF